MLFRPKEKKEMEAMKKTEKGVDDDGDDPVEKKEKMMMMVAILVKKALLPPSPLPLHGLPLFSLLQALPQIE